MKCDSVIPLYLSVFFIVTHYQCCARVCKREREKKKERCIRVPFLSYLCKHSEYGKHWETIVIIQEILADWTFLSS